ncbi:MAG TPA: YkgJ family cysteine cluster protein [Planctomycetota bacterium]|jgi:hypothetical protein
MSVSAENPWFKDGLHFACQPGCVRCCCGDPGDVFVTSEEIAALAKTLEMTVPEFENAFVRHYSSGLMSIIEMPNGDCAMLDGRNGCRVYAVRPKQCRDYPFWPEVLRTAGTWVRESRRCPGLNTGPLHDAQKIIETLRTQKEI